MPRLLIALLCCVAAAVHAEPFNQPSGPHAVGLKVVQQYDRTRQFKGDVDLVTGEPTRGERARPMQALVWYPAVAGGKPVTYRDYLETFPTEDDFTRGREDVRRMTDSRIDSNAGTRRDAILRDIARPMHAVRDAQPAKSRFPVVIYAPSFAAPAAENADLCEYLASHGYIVLASPSMGAHTRAMTLDMEGVETQAADISYLIGQAASMPQADAGNVAVVGFSWGGLANAYAAARDARVRALVSLDGSLRSFPNFVDGGKDAARYVTPARVAVPLLYVGARPKTVEQLNSSDTSTAYSFINAMKYSDVYVLTMLPMQHANFSSFALRMAQDNQFTTYTRDEVHAAHAWSMLATRRFLDAYLKGDAAGLAFLDASPEANKAPRHTVLAEVRKKSAASPPTMEALVRQLGADGFEQAIPAYDRFAAQGFKLTAVELYSWGAQLAHLNRPAQAREIFRLGVHLDRDNADMLDGLAEMQAKTGQVAEALANYRRVLTLNPSSTDAARYIKEHGGSAGAAP